MVFELRQGWCLNTLVGHLNTSTMREQLRDLDVKQNAVCFKRIFDVYADETFIDVKAFQKFMQAMGYELELFQCRYVLKEIMDVDQVEPVYDDAVHDNSIFFGTMIPYRIFCATFFEVAYNEEAQSDWAIQQLFGSLSRETDADGACLRCSLCFQGGQRQQRQY